MTEVRLSIQADDQAAGQAGAFAEAFMREAGIAADDVARFLIALEELVTNVVKYGYSDETARGSVSVTLRLEGDTLRVVLVDDARIFDPFALPAPDLDAALEARPVGGLGLYLVKTMMDETDYRREGGQNVTAFGRRVLVASK